MSTCRVHHVRLTYILKELSAKEESTVPRRGLYSITLVCFKDSHHHYIKHTHVFFCCILN